MGGDHALKFGGYWRDSNYAESTATPAVTRARAFRRRPHNDCPRSRRAPTGCQCATSIRDGYTIYSLTNYSAYAQDT